MTMKITTAAVIFMGSMMLMRADQLVESVQQALKDEGFYYGEVNGDMNANLTAAIRRYQIRNGLQVTGELNDETLRSLGIKSSGSVATNDQGCVTDSCGGCCAERVALRTKRKPQVQLLRFSLSVMRHKASRFFPQLPWVRPVRREQFLPTRHFRPLLPACNAM